MKTSALLLDDSGKSIDDWCAYFSVAPHPDDPTDVAKASVVHSFLIEGHLEEFQQSALADFVNVVERPFHIVAVECLYLNRDVIYDEKMIKALAHFTRNPGKALVVFVSILPAELSGAGLMLDRKTLNEFKSGYPLWHKGALSCSPRRGERRGSVTSKLLRKAIVSWTVNSELTVRHALYRAKKERRKKDDRTLPVRDVTKGLVQYFLGYHPSNVQVDFSVQAQNVDRVNLEVFKLNEMQHEARRDRRQKLKTRAKAIDGDPPLSLHARLSKELEKDIRFFDRLNPGCIFDARSVSEWNLRVILILRTYYTISNNIDNKRTEDRVGIRGASNYEDKDAIAEKFSHLAFEKIKGSSRSKVGAKDAWVSHLDLMGTSETAIIPFFADIDPRIIGAQLYPSSFADQDALYDVSRWLGRLHRNRCTVLTVHQSQNFQYLFQRCSERAPLYKDDKETEELKFALRMVTSFITPVGLLLLEDAAKAAISDTVGRAIYAVDPVYELDRDEKVTVLSPAGAPEHFASHPTFRSTSTPLPIFVPAGRLLIPGDYMESWFEKSDGLENALQEWFRKTV